MVCSRLVYSLVASTQSERRVTCRLLLSDRFSALPLSASSTHCCRPTPENLPIAAVKDRLACLEQAIPPSGRFKTKMEVRALARSLRARPSPWLLSSSQQQGTLPRYFLRSPTASAGRLNSTSSSSSTRPPPTESTVSERDNTEPQARQQPHPRHRPPPTKPPASLPQPRKKTQASYLTTSTTSSAA